MIAQWYKELGLSYAAKYYALALGYISFRSTHDNVKKYIPVSMYIAAECEYDHGAWISFIDASENALLAQLHYTEDPINLEKYGYLTENIYYLTIALTLSKDVDSLLFESLQNIINGLSIAQDVEGVIEVNDSFYKNMSLFSKWDEFEEQLLARPFSDLGIIREFVWKELDITWKVIWNNSYDDSAVVEQFIALLQIYLASYVKFDVVLISDTIEMNISLSYTDTLQAEQIFYHKNSYWNVLLPLDDDRAIEDIVIDYTRVFTEILICNSLLPANKFYKYVEEAIKDGLESKLLIGQQYQYLYKQFTQTEQYTRIDREAYISPTSNKEYMVRQHNELGMIQSISNEYNKSVILEQIAGRYDYITQRIPQLIDNLNHDAYFKSVLVSLRNQNWKDWHILSAIFGIFITYATIGQQSNIDMTSLNMEQIIEESGYNIPLDIFTEERMKQQLLCNLVRITQNIGLEINSRRPNLNAILDILVGRFRFFEDDVKHEVIFTN
ncbi:MAG: hypothetical protein ACYDBB_02115 [Armatimonadota bacterium]